MKIQHLAIIFIIIVLPMTLILSSYISSRVNTLDLQISYDTKLYNATYDAIKAFQLNTINSSTSDLSDSKIRDIQASVNSFYNSLQTNFGMNGYDQQDLQNHVPALVYGMYDGYYIYSPYHNTEDNEKNDENGLIFDLKPYVYYSCRYVSGTTDVVITYSLDSYVTIRGQVGSNTVDLKGYLLSSADATSDVKYRNIKIDGENDVIKEQIIIGGSSGAESKIVPCRKITGVKYYKVGDDYYRISNGKLQKRSPSSLPVKVGEGVNEIVNNTNAQEYYKQSYQLKQYILGSALRDLRTTDAVDENGNHISWDNAGYKIFEELDNGLNSTQIEDNDSNFNSHRIDVIKYCIEKNLSVAISNFNNVSGSTTVFEMPKLRGTDWDKITKNVSMISFLQGLGIGGKIYNGYAIITNNKNEEFVADESIYIETADGYYHNIKDKDLAIVSLAGARGYFNTDYEKKSIDYEIGEGDETVVKSGNYYPREALGCYHSIVSQDGMQDRDVQDILAENADLAKIYYTALARERYGLYRVENAY